MSGFTGDLLIIVPSRGRPKNIARLLDSLRETSKLRTHLHVCVDDDDPALPDYERVMNHAGREDDVLERGPRKGLGAWTNEVAIRRAYQYPYLASFGDDHVPQTPGWDYFLIRAIEDLGGTGFSYPWDGADIPQAVVVSSDIVRKLGWMCEPSLNHWYVDNVWLDLGLGADCIRHCRVVSVDHVHPGAGKAPVDKTYTEASPRLASDREAYYCWYRERMTTDVAKITALREKGQVLHTGGLDLQGQGILASG